VIPGRTAVDAARFLTKALVLGFAQAGWQLRLVLTDRGSEFQGEFDQACRDLGVTHFRTKPRHAWTNGFVERLQGTILPEHRRPLFLPRCFIQARELQASVGGFLRFCNGEQAKGTAPRAAPPRRGSWGVAAHASVDEA